MGVYGSPVNMTLLLVAVLLWSALPAYSDHTGMCVNFPHVKYKAEQKPLRSMGFHLFPDNAELANWTFYQEGMDHYHLLSGDKLDNQHHIAALWSNPHHYPAATLNVYMIKHKNRLLNGWFRVEFKFKANVGNDDMYSCLKMFMLSATDGRYHRQDIGEFVWEFPTNVTADNNCPTNDASKYMLVSCGGASKNEPMVSNMVVLVRDNPKDGGGRSLYPNAAKGLKIIPNLKGKRSLNFYIRIPIQDCNQKDAIVFIARMMVDRSCLTSYSTHQPLSPSKTTEHRIAMASMKLIQEKIPGIAGALPVPSQANDLDCVSGELKEDSPPAFAPFIQSYHNYPTFANNFDHGTHFQHLHGCQGEYYTGRCRKDHMDMLKENFFSNEGGGSKGARELVNQNVASGGSIPICEHYKKPFTGDKYHSYVKPTEFNGKTMQVVHTQEYLRDKTKACKDLYNGDRECTNIRIGPNGGGRTLGRSHRRRFPYRRKHKKSRTYIHPRKPQFRQLAPIGEESEDFLSTWNNMSEENKGYLGVPFEKHGYTQLIWGMKQAHGVIIGVVLFFVMPVNLFITRYYKESFMNKRILYSRVWYQVHVQGTFITGTLLLASVFPVIIAKHYLGYSITTAAYAHRRLGWITIVLFGFLTLFGGFRGYTDGWRKASICAHWLVGMTCYVLMYVLMLNGLFIPGNGVAKRDRSHLLIEKEPDGVYENAAFIHVFIWLLFDLFMHMIMTCNLLASDKKMEVYKARIYLPVPIPVIKEHSTANAAGYGLRVVCLGVYMFCALLSTIVFMITNIEFNSFRGKGLGPMSCTHDPVSLQLLKDLTENCIN